MQSAVSTQATNQMSTAVGPQSLSSAAPQTMPQGPTPQISSPTKDVNTASLCSVGQQAVQDLVQKTQEMFKLLKDLQLPNGANVSAQLHQEKRNKVEETLKFMGPYFRKLRIVYNKVLEDTAHLEGQCIENILPVEEEDGRVGGLQQQMNDAVPYASQERQELIEQIQAKNRHLKEIIDKLRLVIWEINTMLDMRKV